jgi:antitoxin component YwqK of YwqJK toxin-antitoxin module
MRILFLLICLVTLNLCFSQTDSLHVSRFLPAKYGEYPFTADIEHLTYVWSITGEEPEIKTQTKSYPFIYDATSKVIPNSEFVAAYKKYRLQNFNAVYKSGFSIPNFNAYRLFEENIPPFIDSVPDGVYVRYYKDYPYADGDTLKFYKNRIATIFSVKNQYIDGNAYWFTLDKQQVYKSGKYEKGIRKGQWSLKDFQPNLEDAYEIKRFYRTDLEEPNANDALMQYREINNYPTGKHTESLNIINGNSYEIYFDSILMQKNTDSSFEIYTWKIPPSNKLFKAERANRQLIEKAVNGPKVEIFEADFLNRNNAFFTHWRGTFVQIENVLKTRDEESYYLNTYQDQINQYTGEIIDHREYMFDFSEYESYYKDSSPFVVYKKDKQKEKLEIFNKNKKKIFSREEVDSTEVLKWNKHYFDTIKSKVYKNYIERSYDEKGTVLTFHLKSYIKSYYDEFNHAYVSLLCDQDLFHPSTKRINGRLHEKINSMDGEHFEYVNTDTEKYRALKKDSSIILFSSYTSALQLEKSLSINFYKQEVNVFQRTSDSLNINVTYRKDSLTKTEIQYFLSNKLILSATQNLYDFYSGFCQYPIGKYLNFREVEIINENGSFHESNEAFLNQTVSNDIRHYYDELMFRVIKNSFYANSPNFILKKDNKLLNASFTYDFISKKINVKCKDNQLKSFALSSNESALILNEIDPTILTLFNRSDTNRDVSYLPASKYMRKKEIYERVLLNNPKLASFTLVNGKLNGKFLIVNDLNQPIKKCFYEVGIKEGEDEAHQFSIEGDIYSNKNFVHGVEEGLYTMIESSKRDTLYTKSNYRHGQLHGSNLVVNTSNTYFISRNYVNGLIDGQEISKSLLQDTLHTDTLYTISNYTNGILEGKYTNRKVNVKEETVYFYKKGKWDGPVYEIKGKDTTIIARYKDGLNDSIDVTNYIYGIPGVSQKTRMKFGRKNGAFELNDINTKKRLITGTYKNDTIEGLLTFYYLNGKQKATFYFSHGLLIDKALYYDSLGNLIQMHELDSGNFVRAINYYNGKIFSISSLDSNKRFISLYSNEVAPLTYDALVIGVLLEKEKVDLITSFFMIKFPDKYNTINHAKFTYREFNANTKMEGTYDYIFCIPPSYSYFDYQNTNFEINEIYTKCGTSNRLGTWYFSPKNGKPYAVNYDPNTLVLPKANLTDSNYFYAMKKITQFANKRKSKVLWDKYVIENTSLYNCSDHETYDINTYYVAYEKDSSMHLRNGFQKNYYPNGVLQSEGMNKNGLPTGGWKFYNDNGSLREVGNYNFGIRVGRWLAGDLSRINYLGDICMDMNDPKNVALQKELENQLDIEEAFYENGSVVSRNFLRVIR